MRGGKVQGSSCSRIQMETARLSWRLPGSFSTESSLLIPGTPYVFVHVNYDRLSAIDITLIMLWLAPCKKSSLVNASLD